MAKKRFNKDTLRKISIEFFLFIIILLVLFFFGVFKKTCFDDNCFGEAVSECKPVEFVKQKNNNLYVYSIGRSFGNECKVNIKLSRVALGSDPDVKELLEGKEMKCKIPKILLKNGDIDHVNNLLQYCSGELKDGILELLIKRMYSRIIGNLDEITEKVGR